ncbi:MULTISPECIES: hypothetical protein [unclassified Dehalobacter]|uniref:hypothetical protein n=1 Tax=unclassified Dehalobacter TaxID=2635733 RepID=UPI000E6BDE55|nr:MULTISPECIES: hypothetical protein [unclassified Dehalobacter]RJE47195.1 hypothetical protein A7K50_04285 [Dehalobacter sp. MCB1]TCX53559.1 hypothetical protein C1I36_02120 [Dehalobacter sp. 14DCB1]TCX54944.1 hypothetical protein C1I38_04520 [Dehalobacter sp. 12DCB1]
MAYVVKSSERLRPSAADTETKSLLYLMNFRDDSDEIHYFVVDFFNDLTGMSKMSDKLWDLQSKGDKQSSPHAIGAELVTLYKNYISEFEFDNYILFLGGVSNTVRVDDKLSKFTISNVKETALANLKNGLIEECKRKTYIANEDISEEKIDKFLKKVHFVIDDQSKADYVKKIIKLNSGIIPKEETLIAIFNEIRDVQAGKKNISVVEGVTVVAPDEALNYGRHLTTTEIRLLVLNRILNQNVIGSNVPRSFINTYIQFPEEKRKNMLEDCQLDLSRALFNSNCQEDFWKLFENIYNVIINNPSDDINELYRKLDKNISKRCMDFETLSLKYFISLIKDGIEL